MSWSSRDSKCGLYTPDAFAVLAVSHRCQMDTTASRSSCGERRHRLPQACVDACERVPRDAHAAPRGMNVRSMCGETQESAVQIVGRGGYHTASSGCFGLPIFSCCIMCDEWLRGLLQLASSGPVIEETSDLAERCPEAACWISRMSGVLSHGWQTEHHLSNAP